MSKKQPLLSAGEGLAILANVGVVIGLIFVWMEIRQNQTQLSADVELNVAGYFQTAHGRAVDNREVAEIMVIAYTDPEALTPTEYVRLMSYHSEWMVLVFATYQLWRSGAIDDDVWRQHSSYYLLFLTTPWMQDFWRNMIHDDIYPQHFLDELESRLPEPQIYPAAAE